MASCPMTNESDDYTITNYLYLLGVSSVSSSLPFSVRNVNYLEGSMSGLSVLSKFSYEKNPYVWLK